MHSEVDNPVIECLRTAWLAVKHGKIYSNLPTRRRDTRMRLVHRDIIMMMGFRGAQAVSSQFLMIVCIFLLAYHPFQRVTEVVKWFNALSQLRQEPQAQSCSR